MGRLRDDIEAAKAAFEEDVKTQNMEIANLKDCLLEVQIIISISILISAFIYKSKFYLRPDELPKDKRFTQNNWRMSESMRVREP